MRVYSYHWKMITFLHFSVAIALSSDTMNIPPFTFRYIDTHPIIQTMLSKLTLSDILLEQLKTAHL